MTSILTEDEVVEAVCRYLTDRGFQVDTTANVFQKGHDIVAHGQRGALTIEAKGAGSSKPATARFGREFTSAQVFDHVAKAVLKALRVTSEGTSRAGIALPQNPLHLREVELVHAALAAAEIGVFWVSPVTREVTVQLPWPL